MAESVTYRLLIFAMETVCLISAVVLLSYAHGWETGAGLSFLAVYLKER
jgi:hypothetical protein